jgi:hypothetical protein
MKRIENDPCWKGYARVGEKKKNGKTVPNCVPIKESKHAESENPVDLMTARSMTKPQASMPDQFIMSEMSGTESMEPNAAMAINQLRVMREKIDIMLGMLYPDDNLEPWMAAKLTMSSQNLASVCDYMRFGVEFSETLDYTTCERPDGSRYGTGGKCRKGTEVDSLKAEIKRQETFLQRMSPGKYTKKEREIEEKTLQEMKSRLAGLQSTQKKPKSEALVAPVPPKSAMTKKDPVANALKTQKETSKFTKEENARLGRENPKLLIEALGVKLRKMSEKYKQLQGDSTKSEERKKLMDDVVKLTKKREELLKARAKG